MATSKAEATESKPKKTTIRRSRKVTEEMIRDQCLFHFLYTKAAPMREGAQLAAERELPTQALSAGAARADAAANVACGSTTFGMPSRAT